MAIFDLFRKGRRGGNLSNFNVENPEPGVETRGQRVKVVEVGSTGIENYSGYLDEEYLKELKGAEAADIYDKMERSDPKIKMNLSAVSNPLLGGRWTVDIIEEHPEAQKQQELFQYILFEDLDRTWHGKLQEILTLVKYGYSLFEKTHKPVVNDKTFGNFIGLAKLGYRSQKTIERWNLDQLGRLESVSQYAFGDAGKLVNIPAEYLVRFALQDVGDNFEGLSMLRACYGPWFRKNQYLRQMAVGIERFGTPTPIVEVPQGKINTPEFSKIEEVLRRYVSHQNNYLLKPQGYNIDFSKVDFDPSKVRAAIDSENEEMVNAFLANFLQLGQSGSGSYALSFDLSDFFLGAIEHIATHICEVINKEVLDELTALNFASGERYVGLKCHGIRDKAGKEFADVITSLVREGIVKADDRLEENIRERYKLPVRDEESSRDLPEKESPFQFAESKKKVRSPEVKTKIKSARERIEKAFEDGLGTLTDNLVSDIMKTYRQSSRSDRPKAARVGTIRGIREYKRNLTDLFATIHNEAITQVKGQYPRFKRVKLSENTGRFMLAEIDQLNTEQKNRIKTQADLLAETQEADLKKAAQLAYLGAITNTDDERQIEANVKKAVTDKRKKDLVKAGAAIQATKLVNTARKDFFETDEVFNEVESFTFVNSDPVTDICTELNGRTFAADDPRRLEFQPPLHFNCDSWWVPNFKNGRNNPPITEGAGLLSKKAQKSRSQVFLSEIPDKDRKPPKKAQEAAKKVLRWRDQYPDEIKGMTDVGWERAKQIADGGPLSIETIKAISQFARHKENSKIKGEFVGMPWKDAGYVAWQGWGGDSAILQWAPKILRRLEK